jgi:hypothetical protein
MLFFKVIGKKIRSGAFLDSFMPLKSNFGMPGRIIRRQRKKYLNGIIRSFALTGPN